MNHFRPILVRECSDGPSILRKGKLDRLSGLDSNQVGGKDLGCSVGKLSLVGVEDLIANILVAMPHLGQNCCNPSDWYVDFRCGINLSTPPLSVSELSSLCKGVGEAGNGSEKGVKEVVSHSTSKGASCRGRRKVGIPSSHGICTKRAAKHTNQSDLNGAVWEFDAEFANVIEESVNRGVN